MKYVNQVKKIFSECPDIQDFAYKKTKFDVFYFRHLQEEEIVQYISVDILPGNRSFEVNFGAGAYADAITSEGGLLSLGGWVLSEYLERQNIPNTHSTESVLIPYSVDVFCDQLTQMLALFAQNALPDLREVESVATLFTYRQKMDMICYGRIMENEWFLWEAIETNHWDEAEQAIQGQLASENAFLSSVGGCTKEYYDFLVKNGLEKGRIAQSYRQVQQLLRLKDMIERRDKELYPILSERKEISRRTCACFFGEPLK